MSDGGQQTQTFLPGSFYHLECRPNLLLNYEVSKEITASGDITIKLKVRGKGTHHFNIRTDNLSVSSPEKSVSLKAGEITNFEWFGRITMKETPWVAVIVPDGNLSAKKEVRGAFWEK